MKLYGLDWFIMLLNLYAYYLLGKKNKFGFILGLIGSILGIFMFTYFTISVAMIIMYSVFSILNIKNYIEWKNN